MHLFINNFVSVWGVRSSLFLKRQLMAEDFKV